jgi:signal transduction histidine kinase
MQRLPFALISNEYLCAVYEQYYKAFDRFRKFPQVNTLEENDQFCEMLTELLEEHLSVIPKLVMGAIECSQQEIIDSERLDTFMSSMLRSRISRRVIAEQHLSLTNTFKAGKRNTDLDPDYIGEVFLQCKAGDVVEDASKHAIDQIQEMYPDSEMPEVIIEGASDATFPYIKSHLDYIVGEILRNSVEATVTMFHKNKHMYRHPPPILVSIASSPQHVFIRFSDQGGGIDPEILKHIWSFAKGPGSAGRLQTFREVHTLAGLSTEVKTHSERSKPITVDIFPGQEVPHKGSLEPLTTRLPNVKLGMGLPLSKVYAEYWDGALEVHSLDGYGTDVFFKISCLGNQAERLQLDRV